MSQLMMITFLGFNIIFPVCLIDREKETGIIKSALELSKTETVLGGVTQVYEFGLKDAPPFISPHFLGAKIYGCKIH